MFFEYVKQHWHLRHNWPTLQRDLSAIAELLVAFVTGKFGIICVEDLIHEIYTVGPHFKEATNFLWYFKLNTPNGGWRKKNTHFVDGGDFGCREDKINALLRRMI